MALIALQGIIQGQHLEAAVAKEELRLFGIAQRIEVRFVEVLTSQVICHCGIDGVDAVILGTDATRDHGRLRNLIGAVDANELFDQIDIALQVAAKGWNGNFPTRGTIAVAMHGDAEVERLERLLNLFVADIEANEFTNTVGLDPNLADSLNELACDDHWPIDGTACDFENQINRTEGGIFDALRVDAALEAIRAIGGE